MAGLEVPDFHSVDEFRRWTSQLSEEAIQLWNTNDWLCFYDKFSIFLFKSKELEAVIKEKLPHWKQSFSLIKTEGFSQRERTELGWVAFLEDDSNIFVMEKLYRNYRLRPQQYEVISKLAKDAGEKLAVHNAGIDAAQLSIGLRTDKSKKRAILSMAQLAESEVYHQSEVTRKLPSMGLNVEELRADVSIAEKEVQKGTKGVTQNFKGKPHIFISVEDIRDYALETIFHEAFHAHLQQLKAHEDLKDTLPLKELGKEFYQLLDYNTLMYLPIDYVQRPIQSRLADEALDLNVRNRILKRALKAYKKQPLEYLSFVYGKIAERAFRNKSGQSSERYAMKVADLISQDTDIGRPDSVAYQENSIVMKYKPGSLSQNEVYDRLRGFFASVNHNYSEMLEILNEKDGAVMVKVPSNYSAIRQFQKFYKNVYLPRQEAISIVSSYLTDGKMLPKCVYSENKDAALIFNMYQFRSSTFFKMATMNKEILKTMHFKAYSADKLSVEIPLDGERFEYIKARLSEADAQIRAHEDQRAKSHEQQSMIKEMPEKEQLSRAAMSDVRITRELYENKGKLF